MRTLSREQESMLRVLYQLAEGNAGLVEDAFDNAGRGHGRPPTLLDLATYILEQRGLHEMADELRSRMSDNTAATANA